MAPMYLDVVDLRAFYASRLGVVARRLIGRQLARRWPRLSGECVLGMGYATPYLEDVAAGAERVLAFMPAAQGVVTWPLEGPNRAALVEADALPLPDASVDRALVVHCLEMVADPRDHLREIWRVLAPGGRVILVVPNRSGVWARTEKTPFGYGQPYGSGQLTSLLRDAQFSPLGWSEALAVLPLPGPWLRSGTTWERIGCTLWPAFAGVVIVEATKQLHQAIAVRQRRSRLKSALRPAWIPPGAASPAR
jgi:SAM-dependent methyltransferase